MEFINNQKQVGQRYPPPEGTAPKVIRATATAIVTKMFDFQGDLQKKSPIRRPLLRRLRHRRQPPQATQHPLAAAGVSSSAR